MAGAFSSAFSSAFDVGAGATSTALLLTLLGEEMQIRSILKGATDQSVVIRIVDSATGLPETGVEHNTSGIDLWYRREGAAKVSITEAALSALTDAHSDGGIEHVGDGYYRLDPPDAAFASGANGVQFGGTVTDMVVLGCYVHLVDYNPQDAVRMGLTALPNANADAAGGLPISDAGGLDLDAILGDTNELQTNQGNWLTATGFSTHSAADVWAVGTRTLTAATNISAAIAAAVWEIATSGLTSAGTIGKLLVDNINATISSRSSHSAADAAAAVRSELGTELARIDADVSSRQATFTSSTGVTLPSTVASSAEVTAIQNNTRVVRVVPAAIERPDSGTTTYRIEVLLYDSTGSMEAPDSEPTVALVDQGGTDLSSRLDSATGSLVSTGRYRWIYTASDTDDLEQLVWTFSVVEGGSTRLYGNTTLIVDTTAVDFTSADRTKLEAVYNKLPSKTYLTGTANSDGDIEANEATGNFPGSVASVVGAVGSVTTVNDKTGYALATAPPTAAEIVNEWESQSQADPTGFHVNIKEVNGNAVSSADDFKADVSGVATSTELAKVPKSDSDVTWNATALASIEAECEDALQLTVPDTVPADGSRPNVQQAVRMILQILSEHAISGTTWTIKKEDGSTTLLTLTLDDATNPTSATRAI